VLSFFLVLATFGPAIKRNLINPRDQYILEQLRMEYAPTPPTLSQASSIAALFNNATQITTVIIAKKPKKTLPITVPSTPDSDLIPFASSVLPCGVKKHLPSETRYDVLLRIPGEESDSSDVGSRLLRRHPFNTFQGISYRPSFKPMSIAWLIVHNVRVMRAVKCTAQLYTQRVVE
jgi:hypothetical protein